MDFNSPLDVEHARADWQRRDELKELQGKTEGVPGPLWSLTFTALNSTDRAILPPPCRLLPSAKETATREGERLEFLMTYPKEPPSAPCHRPALHWPGLTGPDVGAVAVGDDEDVTTTRGGAKDRRGARAWAACAAKGRRSVTHMNDDI